MKQSIYGFKKQPKVLAELNQLQIAASRTPLVRAHKNHQQKQADTSITAPELQAAWFNSMKDVIREIDQETRVIPFHARFTFLDIGCCPGGFSSYILSKSPKSTGIGLSLPVQSGGHKYLLEDHLRPRLDLHWFDVTQYQLGLQSFPGLHPLPFLPESRPFDLIILDGHPLRRSGSGPMELISDRLFISSIIIALRSVSVTGGTLLIKLAKVDRLLTSTMIYLLDVLSMDLRLWKPVCMHATQDTFYAVAKGFGLRMGAKAYLTHWITHFQELWETLMTIEGRSLLPSDLEFIVSKDYLQGPYKTRLHSLSAPIWAVQLSSIKAWKAQERL